MTSPRPRDVRGTDAWQAAHLDAQRARNERAQAALVMDLDVDLSRVPAAGPTDQLDLFT